MTADTGVAKYLFEMGVLKRIARTGWWFAGITDPESIADHSHRTALVGSLLAVAEGADPARVSLMCIFHDTQETRTGDIPHIGRRYLQQTRDNTEVTADQLAEAPADVQEFVQAVVAEYESQSTKEAIVAKDADKLECLIQAVEYRDHGHKTDRWIASTGRALKTATAKAWAESIIATDPQSWVSERYTGGQA